LELLLVKHLPYNDRNQWQNKDQNLDLSLSAGALSTMPNDLPSRFEYLLSQTQTVGVSLSLNPSSREPCLFSDFKYAGDPIHRPQKV
jgi:hypothetical protein